MCRPRRAPLVRLTRQSPEGARPAIVSRPEPASLAAWRASQVHEVILSGAVSDCKRKDRIIGRFWNNPELVLPTSNSPALGLSLVRHTWSTAGCDTHSQRVACPSLDADA